MVGLASRESAIAVSQRLRVCIRGAVQGVGFRPFVYRLATEMRLKGWVLNSSQGVFIEVEGDTAKLDDFMVRLNREKPPRAYIQGTETSILDSVGFTNFEIKGSDSSGAKSALILPDIAVCPDCIADIFDPTNRRYLYPFTNCTNCGPRLSIVRSLPYDRRNTTMAGFNMCDECESEYHDPSNRRFHAQPNACPKCGPHLELWDNTGKVIATYDCAMVQTAEAIRAGKVVALKGLGGFQLLVDARNDEAVMLLRLRKHREEKPFAVMYPKLEQVKVDCEISDPVERLLVSPEAPIVLLKKKPEAKSKKSGGENSEAVRRFQNESRVAFASVAPSVAPRNPYLGIMLPYSPLHLILMRQLGFPVVATSGNLSDEPICIDEDEALERLNRIADLFLVHDRPIERQVDDSVVRVMSNRTQIVRRARGFAPFPIEMQSAILDSQPEVLAVGGHLKNTVAVNSVDNIFISQHIGDLSTAGAYHAFEKVTDDFKRLYEVSPKVIVHDLHPDYLSTQFAVKSGAETLGVQHHFAHIASCIAENQLEGRVLGISWDGTGYGEDGTIWGSEFLLTDGNSYERLATMRSFRLPGSNTSVKEPRRTALGVLFEVFGKEVFGMSHLAPVRAFDSKSLPILRKMLESGLNSPLTTSAGRLFDAVSSIVGLRQIVDFEGQAAMELEFAADGANTGDAYSFEIKGDERQETRGRKYYKPALVIDWEPIIREILADKLKDVPVSMVSAKFHNSLSEIIVDVAKRTGEERVALSGGCFQNKYLTERTVRRLTEEGFKVYWHQRVPPNDGGISLGQMYVALKRIENLAEHSELLEERNRDRSSQEARSRRSGA